MAATIKQCARTIETARHLLDGGHIMQDEHDRMVEKARRDIAKRGGTRKLARVGAVRRMTGGYDDDE